MAINIDGTSVGDITIDGQQVTEVTIDGTTVWQSGGGDTTVYETFEDNTWPDDWTGYTSPLEITSDSLIGDYSLGVASTGTWPQAMNTNYDTPRGYSYSARIRWASGTSSALWLLVATQDTGGNPEDDTYQIKVKPGNDQIELNVTDGGTGTWLASDSGTLSGDTEYIVVCDLDTDTVRARLLDTGGNEVLATSAVSDTTHTGGYIGVFMDNADAGDRFDNLAQHPLNDVSPTN